MGRMTSWVEDFTKSLNCYYKREKKYYFFSFLQPVWLLKVLILGLLINCWDYFVSKFNFLKRYVENLLQLHPL